MNIRNSSTLLFLTIVLLVTTNAFSGTYYVSTDGSDSYNGLYSSYQGGTNGPRRHINSGIGRLAPGDTLYVRAGTYQETVSANVNGRADAYITISAYPAEKVIIDGYDTLPTGTWGALLSVSGQYNIIRDLEVGNSKWMGAVVERTASYSQLVNLYVHHSRENGIVLVADYSVADGCRSYYNASRNERGTVSNGWGTGISACRQTVSHATIRNCVSWNNWGEGISTFESEYTTIEDNVSYDNWAAEVYLSDTRYCVLQRNIVYRTPGNPCSGYGGAEVGIMQGDESGRPSSLGNTIVNNFVMGARRCYYSWLQQYAGGLVDTRIAYNTFVNSFDVATFEILSGTHSNSEVVNNIILQENSLPAAIVDSRNGITFSNNNWLRAPQANASGAGDVIGDPGLAKSGSTAPGLLTAEYFKIQESSRVRGMAKVLGWVVEDFFRLPRGSAPDIGGHQYGASSKTGLSAPSGLRVLIDVPKP